MARHEWFPPAEQKAKAKAKVKTKATNEPPDDSPDELLTSAELAALLEDES